jgi:hypothetical protein
LRGLLVLGAVYMGNVVACTAAYAAGRALAALVA